MGALEMAKFIYGTSKMGINLNKLKPYYICREILS
jgi:hypothetical protein